MKKLLLFLSMVFVSVMLFTNCGKDGEDGKAFLSYDWDWYTDWYDDNNSATPEGSGGIDPYVDYEVSPGTYNFEYGCSDDQGNAWIFDGTYSITVNAGESGGLISDGAEGADNFFRFNLYGSGPQFGLSKTNKVKALKLNTSTVDILLYEKVPVGEVETEIQHSTNGTMVIKRQMYKLVLR